MILFQLQSMVTMALGAFLETFMQTFWSLCAFTFLNSFGKWAVFQITLVGHLQTLQTDQNFVLQVYLMEAIGFERRLERFPWISYNSLVTITFFIPYCLGKIAATVVIHYIWQDWRNFERWQAVAYFLLLQFSLFVKVFFAFFIFFKGGSLSPPASRSLLSSSSQSRHAGCSSTASRMKDTAHQDIFALSGRRRRARPCGTLHVAMGEARRSM